MNGKLSTAVAEFQSKFNIRAAVTRILWMGFFNGKNGPTANPLGKKANHSPACQISDCIGLRYNDKYLVVRKSNRKCMLYTEWEN